MSRSPSEGARELRKALRKARQDGGLRCQRVEFYERFADVPAGIAELLSAGASPYEPLMFAVAWRGELFACVPVSSQLVVQGETERVLRVIVQDLSAELDEA